MTGQPTATITVTGYPLPEPVIIPAVQPDETIQGDGYLLTPAQTRQLLDVWKDAPGEPDVVREWIYSEAGLFVTALHLDEEITLSIWEAAIGSDGADLYSTTAMPFDFNVEETS
ncbi:hypothetical protein ACFOYW_16630 [Gryllotalpicola reticulitermitis]|uniref:Minor tail protein n=1 Tax=Gryllotalpicola reticulitermitis TaxID=1184153 RepID=A0ABV8Q9H5_9MICO